MKDWFTINNIDTVDTPAVAIFPDRVKANINSLLNSVDDPSMLRPHIKTHKSPFITKLLLQSGITKFKCATVAEAEMLALAGAHDILLAYQPVGPKIQRLLKLCNTFPHIGFSCLIDNADTAAQISEVFDAGRKVIPVFIDLNAGMNRTGISFDQAGELLEIVGQLPGLSIRGLHAYDGHLRDADFQVREQKCNEAFRQTSDLAVKLGRVAGRNLVIVAGGSPTFPVHAKRKDVECSPGTFIYWDTGYASILKEQPFIFAAVVISRVISKPAEHLVCTDLGHKAIASENPLDKRVTFLNAPDLVAVSQSEEHLVLSGDSALRLKPGDVLYGLPYHVCPTVALHDTTLLVEDNVATTRSETTARARTLTV